MLKIKHIECKKVTNPQRIENNFFTALYINTNRAAVILVTAMVLLTVIVEQNAHIITSLMLICKESGKRLV